MYLNSIIEQNLYKFGKKKKKSHTKLSNIVYCFTYKESYKLPMHFKQKLYL